jgi:hypothetical protein
MAYDLVKIFPRDFEPSIRYTALAGRTSIFLNGELVPLFETVWREDRVVAVPDVFDPEGVQGLLKGLSGGARDSDGDYLHGFGAGLSRVRGGVEGVVDVVFEGGHGGRFGQKERMVELLDLLRYSSMLQESR